MFILAFAKICTQVQTLLTAIASLKLVKLDRSTMRYTNTPAAQDELVSTSRKYWGDYIKHQARAFGGLMFRASSSLLGTSPELLI